MNREKYDIDNRGLDRSRGLQHNVFDEVLQKANISTADHYDVDRVSVNRPKEDQWNRSDDPYSQSRKPKGVPVWDHKPSTPEEEAIYYGTHIHSESNPLGLHTHVKGGQARGGHSHSPQNIFGCHHHKDDAEYSGPVSIDGAHTHEGKNYPDGSHDHHPDNFG